MEKHHSSTALLESLLCGSVALLLRIKTPSQPGLPSLLSWDTQTGSQITFIFKTTTNNFLIEAVLQQRASRGEPCDLSWALLYSHCVDTNMAKRGTVTLCWLFIYRLFMVWWIWICLHNMLTGFIPHWSSSLWFSVDNFFIVTVAQSVCLQRFHCL